jgi:hypothetical protein
MYDRGVESGQAVEIGGDDDESECWQWGTICSMNDEVVDQICEPKKKKKKKKKEQQSVSRLDPSTSKG